MPIRLLAVLPFHYSSMAKKKRTATQFFDDAEMNGLESPAKADLNGDKVFKHLEFGTEII